MSSFLFINTFQIYFISCTLCGVGQKLPINDDAICDKAAASAHCKCIKVNHHIFTALGRLCTSAMVRNFKV